MLDFLRRKDKRRAADLPSAAAAASNILTSHPTAAAASLSSRKPADPTPILRDRNLPSASASSARRQQTQHRPTATATRTKLPDKENGHNTTTTTTTTATTNHASKEDTDGHRRRGRKPAAVAAAQAHQPDVGKKRKGLRKRNRHEAAMLAKSVTSDRRRSVKVATPVAVPAAAAAHATHVAGGGGTTPVKKRGSRGLDKVVGGVHEVRKAVGPRGEHVAGHQRKPSGSGPSVPVPTWPHVDLAEILRSNDITRADIAIRRIGAAALRDDATKMKMIREGVAASIVALLRHEDATVEMRRDAAYALAELAVLDLCEEPLVAAGTVPVLCTLIGMAKGLDRGTLSGACRGLRNLLVGKEATAVQAAKYGSVEPLLAIIDGRAVRVEETGVVVEAAAAISNFSQHGSRFQSYVIKHGGLASLTTLGTRTEDEEALFHVVNVLAEFAREVRWHKAIVAADGLFTAFRALRQARDLEVVAEASRLIGNVAVTQKARTAVREAGGLIALIDRLNLCRNFKDVVPAFDIVRALANVCVDARAAADALSQKDAATVLLRVYTAQDAQEKLIKTAFRALQVLAHGSATRRAKVLYSVGIQVKQAGSAGLPVKRLYDLRQAILEDTEACDRDASAAMPESLERLSRASIRLINSGVVSHAAGDARHGRKAQQPEYMAPSGVQAGRVHTDAVRAQARGRVVDNVKPGGQRIPHGEHLIRRGPFDPNKFKSTGRVVSVTRNVKQRPQASGMQQLAEGRMVPDEDDYEALPRGNEEAVASEAEMRAKMLEREANGNMVQDYFEIGQVLGKGGYGSVFMAKDIRSGEIVAIKRFHNIGALVDKKAVKEQNIWKGLHHPNVVEFKGSFVGDNGSLNLVVEYVDGLSLAEHLSQYSAFPETLVAEIARQVLNGLEYLHMNGVTHRDLKPANILVDSSAAVKICDFGVSRSENVQTINPGQQHMVGTPWYIAPEMVEYRPYTTSVDIWSLGCTALELATGRRPYHELSAMQVLFRMVEDRRPPIPPHLSAEAQDFLRACWIWDPQERPSATELLRHPFVLKARKLSDSSKQVPVENSAGHAVGY